MSEASAGAEPDDARAGACHEVHTRRWIVARASGNFSYMRSVAVVIALAGFAVISASASRATSEQTGSCVAARVHYDQAPNADLRSPRLPWVSAGRRGREIVGYIWYYTPALKSSERLRIYVGGKVSESGASTKIMWVPRRVVARTLTVTGRRLDGAGTFRQEFAVAHAGQRSLFPSIVVVPSNGCWLLTVSNGRNFARFAVEAISADSP